MKSNIKKLLKGNILYFIYKRLQTYDGRALDSFIKKNYANRVSNYRRLKMSMFAWSVFRGVRYSDYYLFRFEEKNLTEKWKFVPRSEEMNLYVQVNAKKYVRLLEDKGECYQLFKRYYHRDLVKISKEDIEKERFEIIVSDFAKKHSKFILKPLNLYCGIGIRVVDISSPSFSIPDLAKDNPGGFVLEELISQGKAMASLHENSVNTVRIVSVNMGDTIEIKWPFLRVGRGNAVVDNAGAGGIFVAIDRQGKTFAAADEARNAYIEHPESKKSLIGFEIPKWYELCQLTKDMASTCPDCHIMGWDMAYTEKDGWVVVECNYGPNLVSQFATNVGVRDEFEYVRKKLGAKRYVRYQLS